MKHALLALAIFNKKYLTITVNKTVTKEMTLLLAISFAKLISVTLRAPLCMQAYTKVLTFFNS